MKEQVDLTWLEGELKKENMYDIDKLLSVEITPAVSEGENYASVLLRLKLRATSQTTGHEKDLSLILKRKLDYDKIESEELKKRLDVAYLKEYHIYTNIIPQLEKYCQVNGNTKNALWANCVASIESSDLYFEDLKESGYRVSNRLVGLDYDHCLIVFKSLAIFHAASYMAIKQGLIDTELFLWYSVVHGMSSLSQRSTAYDFLADVIEKEWGQEWKHLAGKLIKLKSFIRDKVIEHGDIDESRINVLNHGDTWVNNMMFKYDSKEKPTSLKFVDFQLSHYNSFAYDLSYFLNTSVGGDLKEKHMEEWIAEYCNSFRATLEAQGSALAPVTPDQVKSELKRICLFSLSVCVRNRPVIMARPENAQPLSELMKPADLNSKRRIYYINPVLTDVLKIDLPNLLSSINV